MTSNNKPAEYSFFSFGKKDIAAVEVDSCDTILFNDLSFTSKMTSDDSTFMSSLYNENYLGSLRTENGCWSRM